MNILELDAGQLCKDLYWKQVGDKHWIENNLLNLTTNDIQTGYFSTMIEKKLYKNHCNLTTDEKPECFDNYNTKLKNGKLSCGDLIYVDANCSDFVGHGFYQLWYVVLPDGKTMQRIGIQGDQMSYIFWQTYHPSFADPLHAYSTLLHLCAREEGVGDLQIEFQVLNNCAVFDKTAKHHDLKNKEKNRLLSNAPWPSENDKTKVTHRHKHDLDEMSGGHDSNHSTIFVDIRRETCDEYPPIFAYCNNGAVEAINLSFFYSTAKKGYLVKYKGDEQV